MSNEHNRPLTDAEHSLAQWMLEHGTAEAKQYIAQLDLAEVTPWRCPCGCASINFQIKPPPGVHVLADFVTGEGDQQSGAFIYSSGGLLKGIEIYSLAGDAPPVLPRSEDLRAYEAAKTPAPHGGGGGENPLKGSSLESSRARRIPTLSCSYKMS
jgi:hypothetical protein